MQTVKTYNAAVQDRDFNPTVKDGKCTQGIEPAKTNWALRLEAPPFVAYKVCCGITFTYGGVITNPQGEVLHRNGAPIPHARCRLRAPSRKRSSRFRAAARGIG